MQSLSTVVSIVLPCPMAVSLICLPSNRSQIVGCSNSGRGARGVRFTALWCRLYVAKTMSNVSDADQFVVIWQTLPKADTIKIEEILQKKIKCCPT